MSCLDIKDLCISRQKNGASFTLNVPELSLNRGEILAIVGQSGCGKSTLTDTLGLILEPTSAGTFMLNGKNGQVVLLGSPRQPYQTNASASFYAVHSKMLKIIGALNRRYSFEPQPGSRISMKRYLGYLEGLINNGSLPVELFTSHQIKPDADELLQAYRGLMYDKDNYTGVIINW